MDRFDLRLWPHFVAAGGCSSTPAFIDQITIDSRHIGSSHALFVALQGKQDGHHYIEDAMHNGAKYALVSHSWHPPSNVNFSSIVFLRMDSPLLGLQSLAKCYRETKKTFVVGIAGTYGKTMVKDLLQKMLSSHLEVTASPGSFNSQIGVPLSLFTIEKHHEIALIEAAISEKNEMETLASMITPDAVILAPIGSKHLATLKDLETAEMETLNLLRHTNQKGWVLLPQTLHQRYPCTHSASAHFWDEKVNNLPHAFLLNDTAEPTLPYCITFPDGKRYQGMITSGFYYFINLINMTSKAAWLLGVPSEAIIDVIANYHPEPIRTEIWKSEQGAIFINDSYCADTHAIDQALKLYEQSSGGRKIFLFGGMRHKKHSLSTQLDYKHAGQALYNQKLDFLLLVGSHSYKALTE